MKTLLLTLPLAALVTQAAFAVNVDITTADPLNKRLFDGGTVEDNEIEPRTGTATDNNSWDLEKFTVTISGATQNLNLISGFDLKTSKGFFNNGALDNTAYQMGDIFVRLGAPVFNGYTPIAGVGNPGTMLNADWDYVIHFTSSNLSTYDIIQNAPGSQVVLTGPPPSGTANGGIYHVYKSGGIPIATGLSSTLIDNANAAQLAAVGASGVIGDAKGQAFSNLHDILTVDISSLLPGNLYFSATMDCGNDVLHGHVSIPDGGMTLALLGAGLTGIALARRRTA